MKRFRNLIWPRGEQGSIAPIVALGLFAFTGFMALSIDLGQLFVVQNELQNVADGAALAAAKQLIQPDANNNAVVNGPAATAAAIACAAQNRSLGDANPIVISEADVTFGQWNLTTRQFDRQGLSTDPMLVNAVQVTVRRSGGTGGNPQVDNYFANALNFFGGEQVATQLSPAATATAMLGLNGTSSVDLPLTVSNNYPAGGTPLAQNGVQRLLDKFGPQPAYATGTSAQYRFKDLGGSSLDTTRATFVVTSTSDITLSKLQNYIKGVDLSGGVRFPQIKVGQKIYPASEYAWGSNVKSLFTLLQTRWNAKKNAAGKWRVTVPVYKTTQVTSALPQDSWFKLASMLLPGVSQAYACAGYTVPAVYTQGFIGVDVINVYVKSDCLTSGDQVSQSNSCRNTCYADLEVPLGNSTFTTDKGSNPDPFQKSYKDMNTAANSVGNFTAVPRIVR